MENKNTVEPIEHYFGLESKLKEFLTDVVKRCHAAIYVNSSDSEKAWLNLFNTSDLNWILNINSVYTNRGDISTSSLQKYYHSMFKQPVEDEINIDLIEVKEDSNTTDDKGDKGGKGDDKSHSIPILKDNSTLEEFKKFKTKVIESLNTNVLLRLNTESETSPELKAYFAKFELKNGFLNIFLKERGKELVSGYLNNQKTVKTVSEDQFTVNKNL
jgi:hypothetical protein